MRLSRRTAGFLFAPTVALFMSGTMSFAMTAINRGFDGDFIYQWLRSFGVGFAVAAPLAAFAVPRIQKFFDSVTEDAVGATEPGPARRQ